MYRAGGLIVLQDFGELIERHQAMVFRTLARMTGSSDVEDLAQEVFLRLFRGLRGFRGEARTSTFLYRIIINVVNDEWRRRQQERSLLPLDAGALPSRMAGPLEIAERRQFLSALAEAMEELSPEERAVVTLYFQEERTYEEIAAITEAPLGTVKTHLHRARQKLKATMQQRMRLCRIER